MTSQERSGSQQQPNIALSGDTQLYRTWTMANGRKMFSCLTCTYTTCDRRTIERHKMVHTGEKPYACTECAFRTSRRDTLNNHIRCRHPETFALLLISQQQQQDSGNNDYIERIRNVHRLQGSSEVANTATIAPIGAVNASLSAEFLQDNIAGGDIGDLSTRRCAVVQSPDDSVIQMIAGHVSTSSSGSSSLTGEGHNSNTGDNILDEVDSTVVHNEHIVQVFKIEND